MDGYQSKATIAEISAISRVAVKVKDNYYTVEYSERRTIPDVEGVDIDAERTLLFDAVNAVVDNQVKDIFAATH